MKLEEFIEKASKKHGNRFDYSKVVYKNNKTKVCIICPEHGEFWQTPQEHLKARVGCCPKCSILLRAKRKTYTQEEFIEKCKAKHNNKYDYSKTIYTHNKEKVCIICPKHGEFWQVANSHLAGMGCPKCNKSNKLTKDEFIEKAKSVHGDKYDYSKVEYKNSSTKVCIICPEHGEFWQTPNGHLSGHGCRECDNERKREIKYSTKEIINRFKEVHGDYFDYSKFNYNGIFEKSIIICPIHGEFEMSAHEHIKGHGCPVCNQSALEKEIKDELLKNNIEFEEQKTFDWLTYKSKQYLDFYIPKYNVAIECQGIQHFKPTPFFTKNYNNAEIGFKEIVKRDLNKKKLCEENGVKLLYFAHKNIFIENKSSIKDIIDNTKDIIKEIKYEKIHT